MACCSGRPPSARPPPRSCQGIRPSECQDGPMLTVSARDVLQQHQLPERVADKLEEEDIRTLQTLAGLDDDVLLGELGLKLGEKIKLRQAIAYARCLSRPGSITGGRNAASDELGPLPAGWETKAGPKKNRAPRARADSGHPAVAATAQANAPIVREADLAQKEALTPGHQAEDVMAWFETLRMVLIFVVFLVLRYIWDSVSAHTPRQIPFTDPQPIHPSVLRQIHDT